MLVTYEPQDGDRQEWTFDPKRVRQSEAELVEKRFGENWDVFVAGVQSGSARARRVLLWHLLRLQHHTLRFEDTPDFYIGEMQVEFGLAELRDIRDRAEKMTLSDDQRQQLMVALDLAMSEAIAREGEEPGKAPCNSAGNGTG